MEQKEFKVAELIAAVAELSGGKLPSEAKNGAQDRVVRGFRPLGHAGAGDISFATGAKALKEAVASAAEVLVVPPAMAEGLGERPLVVTADPYAWYAWASQAITGGIHPDPEPRRDPTASVDPTAEVAATARIDAFAWVGPGARVGEHAWIGAGAHVGAGAEIGSRTHLFPHALVGDRCRVGSRCILNMGCVLGGDGFGFAPFGGQWVKIPQVGAVVVGDDVEIGACTTIDRGALEDTVVGNGTKIDNQVQIGHNCRIGSHCVICGCVGIAGSTTVGDHCVLGGAAMINGHISIPAGSMVGPATPLMSWGDKPGVVSGIFPSMPHNEWKRAAVGIRRLDEMRQTLKVLSREVEALKARGA